MVMDSWGMPDDQRTVPGTMGDSYTWTYDMPPGGIKRTVVNFNERKRVINIATDK